MTFKRLLPIAFLFLLIGHPVQAQLPYIGFEQITVDNTAGGKAFTAAKITASGQPQANTATCSSETADIRYTLDGTTVTSSVGVYWIAGTTLTFAVGHDILERFRAIRTAGANATLSCVYTAQPSLAGVVPVTGVVSPASATSVSVASDGVTAAAVPGSASYLGVNVAGNLTGITGTGTSMNVNCTGGCAGGTTDADDASVASGQTTGIQIPLPYMFNGAAWVRQTGDATNGLDVDVTRVTGTVAVSNAGTFATQPAGSVAHDGAAAAVNPVLVGGYASAAAPANVSTDGDSVREWHLLNGSLVSNIAAGGTLVTATGSSLNVNITGGAAGGTAMTDDAAFTVATTTFTPAGGTYRSARDTLDDNDGGAFALNQRRGLYTSLETPSSDSLADDTLDAVKVTNSTASTASAYLTVRVSDGTVFVSPDSQGTHDTALGTITTITGGILGGRADSSAITNVTAGDWVAARFDLGGMLYVASTVTEDIGETASNPLLGIASVRRDVAASSAGTTGDNATVNTDAIGLLWARQLDPCNGTAKTVLPVSISTATTTEITPSLAGASNFYYVCAVNLVTAASNNVALVDDDSDGCGSVTAGMAGGTTAATGWNFAANGGLTLGNGDATVAKTNGTNRVVCLMTSAATQLSGTIVVATAP